MGGQNITNRSKSVAESFASLSLATYGVTFVGDTLWPKIVLVIFGTLFALGWFYLIIPCFPGKEYFLTKIATQKAMRIYKSIGWFIALAMFGFNLIQQDVNTYRIIGFVLAALSYLVLLWGILSAKEVPEK